MSDSDSTAVYPVDGRPPNYIRYPSRDYSPPTPELDDQAQREALEYGLPKVEETEEDQQFRRSLLQEAGKFIRECKEFQRVRSRKIAARHASRLERRCSKCKRQIKRLLKARMNAFDQLWERKQEERMAIRTSIHDSIRSIFIAKQYVGLSRLAYEEERQLRASLVEFAQARLRDVDEAESNAWLLINDRSMVLCQYPVETSLNSDLYPDLD